jgi:homoserine O-acetyltransferase/O-succinyltransferase
MLALQDKRQTMNRRNGHERRRPEIGSVGIVQRQYAHFDQPLYLQGGGSLERFTIAYETYGTLNAERSNAILICHALSGDAHVAGYSSDDPDEAPGWWDDAVGPGKMFDTDLFYVICSNIIGGCQGSTGPSSLAPDGKPYGMRFPFVTIVDMVEAQRRLIDYLGIERLFAVAGGSMGAMQALQWGVDLPERLEHVLFIGSTPRSSTQAIAFNEIGRQAIYADPNWNRGDYYGRTPPDAGLAVARMVGHITYMSELSLERKFGRARHQSRGPAYNFETDFEVESYLQHQGKKFTKRFDANSYLYITKALDYFDIGAGFASMESALRRLQAPVLVITFSSDWLYPAEQGYELVSALEGINREVQYHHVDAYFGHDSFLVEVETMTHLVGGYLDKQWKKRLAQLREEL